MHGRIAGAAILLQVLRCLHRMSRWLTQGRLQFRLRQYARPLQQTSRRRIQSQDEGRVREGVEIYWFTGTRWEGDWG